MSNMQKVLGRISLAGILTIFAASAHADYDKTIRCSNIDASSLAPLNEAASSVGLKLEGESSDAQPPAIMLYEAKGSGHLNHDRIDQMSEYVRQGGRLIVTLDSSPGTEAYELASILPTTAWRTLLQSGSRGGAYPATESNRWDSAMFPQAPAKPLHVPYYFPLRPFDVVEEGMQRYERFEVPSLASKDIVPAGTPLFTRPLLNRDWQTRISAGDVGNSALLITGRYGAGRVAIFASSASFANSEVWNPLLKWLETDQPAKPVKATDAPPTTYTTQIDAEHRSLVVTLSNESNQPQDVEVIGRVLTWEHAMIGDVSQSVQVPANGKSVVTLALPSPAANQPEALNFRDACIVRLGVIGNHGSTLLRESEETVDLQPVTRVNLSLDNLRQRQNPFQDAAGENGESSSMGSRVGEPVSAYAYAPGQDVNVTATLSNGSTNLAPLAKVTDESDPANPSIVAINDQLQPADRTPLDKIKAYGVWQGKADADNSILFTFPHPVHVNEVVITGEAADTRETPHQPGEVIIEADGKQVAVLKDFESQLAAQCCSVHATFSPVDTTTLRVRIPWIATMPDGKKRAAPTIGEIEIHGYEGTASPAVNGKLTLTLSDAAIKSSRVLSDQTVQLSPGQETPISIKIPSDEFTTDASAARFFRVDARLTIDNGPTASSSSTFMVIQPVNPLKPIGDTHPGGAPSLNFVVTRGFRNGVAIGTGTRQSQGAWETPDDSVYAYEHGLKQTGAETRGTARQFFVTENDFRHYCAPWSIFPNGEVYFDVAAPNFVTLEKKQGKWNESKYAQLGFGDRWDTGPAASLLYSWQELVAFDDYLRSQNLPTLTGKTREEIVRDIEANHASRFAAWHMARYAECVRTMSQAFAEAGKKLIFSGQGTPLVPDQYQEELASTIQGMSDDTTWGMTQEDVPATTGRQMATLAFNPVWSFNEVFVWGYDSALLNNPHWHASVGTTESSRRHYSDPGWRGMVDPHGHYRLADTFGFGMNANVSWCMNLNDWQEMWRMQERLALITPDAPLGVGMIVANANWNDPKHATFSGGGMGGSPADSVIIGVAHAFGTLSDLRIPVAFTSNVASTGNWNANTPLVVLDMNDLSAGEIKILQSMHHRGVRLIGFTGGRAVQPEIAELFGVTTDGAAAGAKVVGSVSSQPVLANDTTLLLNVSSATVTENELRSVAGVMRDTLACGLDFPEGTAGYGFARGKQKFIVVEDWKEQGRDVSIRLRATPGAVSASAVNVNEHLPIYVTRDGNDWVLKYTTRPGDGTLLCVEEK